MLLVICPWVRRHREMSVDVKGDRKELCFLLGKETEQLSEVCPSEHWFYGWERER